MILLALGSAIVLPPVATGFQTLQAADTANRLQNYQLAAASYRRASYWLPWRSDLWEKIGNAEFAAGQYQAAIAPLREAAERGSISPSSWGELGSSYLNAGDRLSAVSTWLEGSRIYPQDSGLLDQLAGAYRGAGDYAAERRALERRLQLGGDAEAHYRLGLLILVSDPAGAAAQLGSAASMDAQFAPAVNTLQQALRVAYAQTDPASGAVVLGRALALVQEWDLARLAFEHASELDPSNAQAWAWLGEAKQQTGEGGSFEVDRALELDPRDSVVHILAGLYFRREGRNAKAASEYNRAAALDPKNPAIQVSLGEALAANGDLVAGLAAYRRATELAPGVATYWRLLAVFCADNDVQVTQVGLPAAQRAAQIAPKDPQALDALGWSVAQADYFEQAEATLLRAIHAAPSTAYPHVHLATVYLRLGDRGNALVQFNLALQVDPNGPAADAARQLLKQYFP
jgi:protein O-GlcNAc transferase